VFVPNNKLFSDNILNYSANDYRMANFRVQLAREVDPNAAIALFCQALQKVNNILATPRVTGTITEFNTLGIVITLQVPCHHGVYTSVTAQGNQTIFETLKNSKFPLPENRTVWVEERQS
jgi:small conductance mechanosensitive channel